MSLGSILLSPQPLELPLVLEKDRAVRATHEFLSRLARELSAGGRGLQIFGDALTAALEELIDELQSRLGAARSSLESLLASLLDLFDLSGIDDPAAAIQKITTFAAKIADDLTPAEVGRVLNIVFGVIENDLGLSETRMRALFTNVTARLVEGFKADFRANPTDPGAYNRYALGSALEELLDSLPLPPLPSLTRTEIVPRIVNALQGSQFEANFAPIRNGIKYASTALSGVGGLGQFFPDSVFGAASVGAAATPQKYCWYGSWLQGDSVKSTNAPNCDRVADIDFGPKLTLSVMDGLARHSKWSADTVQFILHASSIQTGDMASNILNMVYRLVEIGINLFGDFGVPRWVPWVSVPVITALGGFERFQFNDAFGLTLMLADGGEAQLYARWAWVAREALLSIFTLANHDDDKFNQFLAANPVENMTPEQKAAFEERVRNHNYNQIDGLALAFGEIGSMIMPLILRGTDKDDYGFPDGGGSWGRQVGFALLGAVFSIGFAFGGGFGIGAAVAGKCADANRAISIMTKERILGRLTFADTGRSVLDAFRIIPVIVTYLVDYFLYLFMFIENATEDGKFASKQRKAALTITEYPGYPDRTASPYRLPYAKGTLQQCAQGNLGIWSHTPVSFSSQVYAYDFSLDDDTPIHAARGGILVDFRDDVADGTSAASGRAANFVQIVHDIHVNGHDFDEKGGTADSTGTAGTINTICEYLHGKQNTVTAAFAALTPPLTIKPAGTKAGWPFAVAVDGSGNVINDAATGNPQFVRVNRGQVIMHADSTGRSAYNHLHTHVFPAVGTLSGASPSVDTGDGTIPFVYGDDDVAGDKGVPRSFKWYKSGNEP